MPVAAAWARRGLTLLWGAEALRDVATPAQVLPLRTLFSWRNAWPDELPANNGRALVATGLEATLDCLDEADAETWVATDLRGLVLGFQDAYQGDAALVLWLPSGQHRIVYDAPRDAWRWAMAGNRQIALGRLLFSGAEHGVERIAPPGWRGEPDGVGLIGLRQARLS